MTRKPGRSTGSNRREKSLAFNNAKRHVKMTQVAKASCISRAGGAVSSAPRALKPGGLARSRRPMYRLLIAYSGERDASILLLFMLLLLRTLFLASDRHDFLIVRRI